MCSYQNVIDETEAEGKMRDSPMVCGFNVFPIKYETAKDALRAFSGIAICFQKYSFEFLHFQLVFYIHQIHLQILYV